MPPKRKANMPPKRPGASKKYSVAPIIPEGEILTDFNKKQWRLGKSFATGGFGRLYYAKPLDANFKQNYVIKMEPAENGPLFQEFHVYCRIFKPEMIEKYKKLKGLDFLGVPPYYGAGLLGKNGMNHRFLILPLFGTDLEKIRETQSGGKFVNETEIFRLILTCLDIYQYLHDNQCVHADLKADNLLLSDSSASSKSSNIAKCYLLDYGLAKKVPEHPIFKEQPKKAHDGTLIFTSLDAHRGCSPTYRGDLEILAYNAVYWLSGTLPWIHLQTSPELVFAAKVKFREHLHQELPSIFGPNWPHLKELEQFFEYSYSLNYPDKPNFEGLKSLVEIMMKKSAAQASKSSTARSKSPTKRSKSPTKAIAATSDVAKTKPKRASSKAKAAERLPSRSKVKVSSEESDAQSSPTRATARPRATRMEVEIASPTRSTRPRTARVVVHSDEDSDQDLFDTTRKVTKSGKKYIPNVDETADSSSDDDYCTPASKTINDNHDQYSTPMARSAIRNVDSKATEEAKKAFKMAANRRLSMLEAAIKKKYSKPTPKTRKIVKKRTDPEENGCVSDDKDTEDTGTQTSPALWANRKSKRP